MWVTFLQSSQVAPGTVEAGFNYGQEVAIAREKGGGLYAMNNKMPPTGQPATYGRLVGNGLIQEPISLTTFSMSARRR